MKPGWKKAWIFALLFLFTTGSNATSHVFVRNEEGVWLASDSLQYHNDGQRITASHVCKVAISKGQLFFNAGFFKNLTLLKEQESALPFASLDVTRDSIGRLLLSNHMDLSQDPRHNPTQLVVNTGTLQVENSVFRAVMTGQTDSMKDYDKFVLKFTIGIPHGYGTVVDRVRDLAAQDPTAAARIAANPKAELLNILEEEAIMRPSEVEGPFTVLLLHNDGTVSDFSDKPLCMIPENAQYIGPSKRKNSATAKAK
jgi:hypothetical protein